jgi:hypothetical protein
LEEYRHQVIKEAVRHGGVLSPKRTSVAVKYFREFANRATFQGYSVQIVASIGF